MTVCWRKNICRLWQCCMSKFDKIIGFCSNFFENSNSYIGTAILLKLINMKHVWYFSSSSLNVEYKKELSLLWQMNTLSRIFLITILFANMHIIIINLGWSILDYFLYHHILFILWFQSLKDVYFCLFRVVVAAEILALMGEWVDG